MKKRILVIGGGVTGLCAAYAERKRGHGVTLIERGSLPGGHIRTHEENGFLAEEGPSSILVKDKKVLRFFEEIGLSGELVDALPFAKERFIVRNGRPLPAPRSPLSFVSSGVLSLRGKLRVFLEPFIGKGINADESLSSFVNRRLGGEFLDYLINPFVSGIYAGCPQKLSVKYAFPKLYNLEQRHGSLILGTFHYLKNKSADTLLRSRLISFRSGMQSLPLRLAEVLKENLFFNATPSSIRQINGRWSVSWGHYQKEFDQIILCVPCHALLELPFEPHISTLFSPLQDCHYAPVSVVTCGFEKMKVPHRLNGFGMLVPEKEKLSILGTLFSSSLFPSRAPHGSVTLSTYIGGARSPSLASLSNDALLSLTLQSLQSLLGISANPVFTHISRSPKAIPQYEIGYKNILNTIDSIEKAIPSLFIRGNFRHGISTCQCIQASLELSL
ncbi:MAG: protoporphyrinogen oxidase [Verrucomicrobia bacterium GWC2_42_7]|nr:MAG: protoporphyrinogen oxidase [Verrucomicrobia bacterium GWC2_42_7]